MLLNYATLSEQPSYNESPQKTEESPVKLSNGDIMPTTIHRQVIINNTTVILFNHLCIVNFEFSLSMVVSTKSS